MVIFVLLNNFLHDFSAAAWLFGTVLLWLILHKINDNTEIQSIIPEIMTMILFLMQLSFVGIVLFGIIRALAYKSYEWNVAAGQSQVTLLIVKHIIFTLFFLPGLLFFIKAKRFVRKAHIEKVI